MFSAILIFIGMLSLAQTSQVQLLILSSEVLNVEIYRIYCSELGLALEMSSPIESLVYPLVPQKKMLQKPPTQLPASDGAVGSVEFFLKCNNETESKPLPDTENFDVFLMGKAQVSHSLNLSIGRLNQTQTSAHVINEIVVSEPGYTQDKDFKIELVETGSIFAGGFQGNYIVTPVASNDSSVDKGPSFRIPCQDEQDYKSFDNFLKKDCQKGSQPSYTVNKDNTLKKQLVADYQNRKLSHQINKQFLIKLTFFNISSKAAISSATALVTSVEATILPDGALEAQVTLVNPTLVPTMSVLRAGPNLQKVVSLGIYGYQIVSLKAKATQISVDGVVCFLAQHLDTTSSLDSGSAGSQNKVSLSVHQCQTFLECSWWIWILLFLIGSAFFSLKTRFLFRMYFRYKARKEQAKGKEEVRPTVTTEPAEKDMVDGADLKNIRNSWHLEIGTTAATTATS